MTGIESRGGGPPGDRAGRGAARLEHGVDRDTEPLGAVPADRPARATAAEPPDRPPDRTAGPSGQQDQDEDRQDRRAAAPSDRQERGRQDRQAVGPSGRQDRSTGRRAERRAPSRRGPLIGLLLLAVVVLAGGTLLYRMLFVPPDYDGPGEGDVVVQVEDGDPTVAIGAELARQDVVRSAKAFTSAAADNDKIRAVQPGYYRLRLRMSGADAVALLVDPASRVGQLEIKGGVQLDDTRGPDGTVSPGVLSLVSKASCVQLNGASTCITVAQLRNAMATNPPDRLGVPSWAAGEVAKADPNRRLEGFIAPGRYDLRPGSTAQEVLRTLVSSSARQYEATGLTGAAQQGKYSPYQLLVIASLVEKEGITPDFDKIARVIYNRLTNRVRLELDSTVNYPLDQQQVRTSGADRGRAGAYNSYVNYGLPPTPIGAPGQLAIQAAVSPASGPWMFFVRCQKNGTSCFSTDLQEHQRNVRTSIASGAF